MSLDKTFWGSTQIIFLGFLIDTVAQKVSIPCEKIQKTIGWIDYALNKRNHKITLLELQQLCGLLNFICRCIVPGRAFTRRLYAAGIGYTNPRHHLYLSAEIGKISSYGNNFFSTLVYFVVLLLILTKLGFH